MAACSSWTNPTACTCHGKFKEGFCRREGATEFIGEFDKVYNPLLYLGFAKLEPMLQRLRAKAQHH